MIKFRAAQYCNLKIFLSFLVVYGHFIEPRIAKSDILMAQYQWIYLIHMPLFSFLSGLFINREKDCFTQLTKTFPLYILFQSLAVFFGNGSIKPLTPWWHLWYLLSYCTWLCLAWIWFQFCHGKGSILILICSVTLGCLAGLIPHIGRTLSLSRTLVFFPYFWVGLICKPSFNWRKIRAMGITAFAAAFAIILHIGSKIPVTFLYQATPYESLKNGPFLRLICYLVGGLLILFLLTISPTRRLPFSKMGTNTMLVYLLHAPIVLCLRKWEIPWQFYIIITIAFLYITYMLTRWHNQLYGITFPERRDRQWCPFKKSMKNRLSRSIGSSYP